MTVLLVALGAAAGAPLRYLTDRALRARFGGAFPWGTLAVNVAGSFLLGLLVGLPAGPAATALLGTGFCGALTTYSTFGWETLTLLRDGARGRQRARQRPGRAGRRVRRAAARRARHRLSDGRSWAGRRVCPGHTLGPRIDRHQEPP